MKYFGIALKIVFLEQNLKYMYQNCQSEVIDISAGVQQGSISEQWLFIMYMYVYINDLIIGSNKQHFTMYVDDITIYFNCKDFDPICIKAVITNKLKKVSFD